MCSQDGARLSVSICTRKATVAEVVAEVAALNPPLQIEELMENIEVDQPSFVRPGLALCCWLRTVRG